MNLLALSGSYFPRAGGAEKYLRSVLEHRAELGDRVRAIISHNSQEDIRRTYHYRHGPVEVVSLKSLNIFGIIVIPYLRSTAQIVRMVRDADLVFVNDIRFLTLSVIFSALIFRKPLVLVSHGFYFHTENKIAVKRVYMKFFALASRFFRAVVLVSETDERVARKYNVKHAKFIEEGVDLQHFTDIPDLKERNRFLCFGRVDRNKGIQHLITKISDLNPAYELRVVGRIDDRSYYEQLTRQVNLLGIDKFVTFTGEVPFEALLDEIARAEFVFLPSSFEGFGITLIESLGAGKNVVCQDNESYRAICKRLRLDHILMDFSGQDTLADKISELRSKGCSSDNLSYYCTARMLKEIDEVFDGT